MKKFCVKFVSMFFVLLIAISSAFGVAATFVDESTGNEVTDGTEEIIPPAEEIVKPEITISSDHISVTKGKKIHLKATVTGVEETPVITWTSSDEKIATVDANGEVKGLAAGKTIITASATIGEETISADYALNVVTSSNFIKDFLESRQVLSYQYSYIDDYYYTNDKEAWQYNFGYGPVYDLAAPYILLEYDYVRVFFEYEDKDWMIQLWKGQYGLIFYGSEIGIYNKPHNDKKNNVFTFYSCPPEEDWVKMEMTLYHQKLDGTFEREFTRPYDTYWWCTGFKDGHLRIEEPADELRVVSRLTLKSEEMTQLFAQGLLDCEFKQVNSKEEVTNDTFYVEGSDIYLQWQDINEAENTMPIKVGLGIIVAFRFIRGLLLFPFLGFAAFFIL